MKKTEIRRHVRVKGRVQGVGFRAWVLSEAHRFPETQGFVRNLPDGTVEAVFQGRSEDVLALVSACRKGPPASKVKEMLVREELPSAEFAAMHSEFRVKQD